MKINGANVMNNLKSLIPNQVKEILFQIKNRDFINSYTEIIQKKLKAKDEKKRLIILGTPSFGNLGDHAITEAEMMFLNDNFKKNEIIEISFLEYTYAKQSIQKLIKKNDLIFIHGGGFLGTLWFSAEKMVREIITTFNNNQIIIFPQSIYFDEDKKSEIGNTYKVFNSHPNITILTRDRRSFNFAIEHYPKNNKIEFVPDIVTYLNETNLDNEREGVLFCLRTDKEKINNPKIQEIYMKLEEKGINCEITDTVVDDNFEGEIRKMYLNSKFEQFSKAELIVTDRLHGMIFSLITGTPCIAFDNVSKKVSGVYEWIKNIGYIICITPENDYLISDIDKLILSLKNQSMNGYWMHNELQQKFDSLKQVIQDELDENE